MRTAWATRATTARTIPTTTPTAMTTPTINPTINPKAPAKNIGLVHFYLPPHTLLEPGSHETEETYVILEGEGTMTFANGKRKVSKGDFVYLPPWCVHGIENTGREPLLVLICTSPPNP